MQFDLQKPMNEVKKHIEELRQKDIHNSDFIEFKKTHEFAAEQLDDRINGFYSISKMSTISQIKLPEPIRKEIIYYNFISDKYSSNDFHKNLKLICQKLEEFDSPYIFYVETLQKKIENGVIDIKTNDWIDIFFEKWTFMLTKRIIDFRLKTVEDLRYNYLIEIYSITKNYSKYAKVYKTMYDVFGKIASIEDELANQDIEKIARFAEILYKDPSILTIAQLLGRLNGEDDIMEKNITEQITTYPNQVKLPYNPEELIGITLSKKIENLLPIELASLYDPDFEIIFYKKYIESQLQTFSYESKEIIIEHEVEQVEYQAPIPVEQGKFIICIDTSSSMEGAGEYIAKALAIAVAKIAIKDYRDVVIINFANNEIEEFVIDNLSINIQKMLNFLSKSFYGKTNAESAFKRIINKMNSEEFMRADLLMISDFIMDIVSNNTIKKINSLKEKYNRFHSLIIGTMPNIVTQELFDNVMYYDPNDPLAVQQIIKSLNESLRNIFDSKDDNKFYKEEYLKKINKLWSKKEQTSSFKTQSKIKNKI